MRILFWSIYLLTHTQVKPDGVNRSLVSAIIARFENRGYKLVALKMLTPTMDLAEKHYQEHNGKPFFTKLKSPNSPNL